MAESKQHGKKKRQQRPPQHQNRQPGIEAVMRPKPIAKDWSYIPSGKLRGKVALITGGDSGIGRAVAIHFAMEGADVAVVYYNEHEDAKETKRLVEAENSKCVLIAGDIGDPKFCKKAVNQTIKQLERLDILVNNAAEQHPQKSIEELTPHIIEHIFRTNVFSMFYFVQAALPHMETGSTIINTASVTAYRGSPQLLDYSSTKGAIVAFTRSLALMLVDKGIRVNGVAPGPIWTPLIPSSFSKEHVATFGSDTPMGRAGEPEEVAPCYVFLASRESSYIAGQILHPNGGEIVNT
jgi:NAD(P)-dependent dehydrogenase (short-subunit alcohol dehydrogenase family)